MEAATTPKTVKFTLTIEVRETSVEKVLPVMKSLADRLLGRLTKVVYEEHTDHRIEVSRKTLRRMGRQG